MFHFSSADDADYADFYFFLRLLLSLVILNDFSFSCHSERSEESVCIHVYASTLCLQILRFAQDDISLGLSFRRLSLPLVILNEVKNLCTSTCMHPLYVLEILRFALNDNGE